MDISASSEFELIARLTQNLTTRSDVALGVGDDCAVLDLGGDRLLLATCDSQVEGVHFTFQSSSPAMVGHKALAVNLSDIAAMGGEPRYALISLILPASLPVTVLDEIYVGLRAEAEHWQTILVGGNIASSAATRQLIIDITLLGMVERGQVLTRGGAQVGDLLCVTGGLGDSAAGLYTLQQPTLAYAPASLKAVQHIHRLPQPRVQEGRSLSRFGPSIVTSLLDVSDGLSGDLLHLCERSQVGARLDLAALPLSLAMRSVAATSSVDPLTWALHGGEDYELLFTVSPEHEQAVTMAVQSATGTSVTVIGRILSATDGLLVRYPAGYEEPLHVESWDHLKQSN